MSTSHWNRLMTIGLKHPQGVHNTHSSIFFGNTPVRMRENIKIMCQNLNSNLISKSIKDIAFADCAIETLWQRQQDYSSNAYICKVHAAQVHEHERVRNASIPCIFNNCTLNEHTRRLFYGRQTPLSFRAILLL